MRSDVRGTHRECRIRPARVVPTAEARLLLRLAAELPLEASPKSARIEFAMTTLLRTGPRGGHLTME